MRNAVAIEVSRACQRGFESYPGPLCASIRTHQQEHETWCIRATYERKHETRNRMAYRRLGLKIA